MQTALVIIHVVIAVLLTGIVLMQHGKQQGLSGAIAGGAETFFGKNKGRTVDAMLKKFTAVIAILFIISSVALTAVSMRQYSAEDAVSDSTVDGVDGEGQSVMIDENGNLVNENGDIVGTVSEAMEDAEAVDAEDAEAVEADTADAEAEAPVEAAAE